METAFIIGSPRSGTTILGNILNEHPGIAEWYEPYYLWEKFFNTDQDDIWDINALNDKVRKKIQKEFCIYGNKCGKPMVMDKSPTHSFNAEIISNIFPRAKWIHIVRDGRDVTLSIRREWEKRSDLVQKKSYYGLFKLASSMLNRQPFYRYKTMAVFFEIRNHSIYNFIGDFNKARWKGRAGWGPRFDNWENHLNSHSNLEFYATQWVKSVEGVKKSWGKLPQENRIEIRYENLLMKPIPTLTEIINFLGFDVNETFFDTIPKLKEKNFLKWKHQFSREQLKMIHPIVTPLLVELGYEEDENWMPNT